MSLIAIVIAITLLLVFIDHKNREAKWLRTHRNWLRIPDVNDYMEKIPGRGNRQGISCCHCGSRSIRQPGVAGRYDSRRIHICNCCNRTLYRTYR
jgi:hypothetical protein